MGVVNGILSKLIVNVTVLTPEEKRLKETIGPIAEFRKGMSERFGHKPTPTQEDQTDSAAVASPSPDILAALGNLPISLAGDKLTDLQIRELAKQFGISNTGQIIPLAESLASRLVGMVGPSLSKGYDISWIDQIRAKLGLRKVGGGSEMTSGSRDQIGSTEQPPVDQQLKELVKSTVTQLGSDNWDETFDSHILGRWGIARPLTELLVKRLFGRLPARGGHLQFTHKQITWLLFVQQNASQINLPLSQLEDKFDEIYAGLSNF